MATKTWIDQKAPERKTSPEFLELLKDMARIHEQKATAYSGDRPVFENFRDAIAFGVTPVQSVALRMTDKWERFRGLLAQPIPNRGQYESLEDTLMDLAAYCLIAVVLMREDERMTWKPEGSYVPEPTQAPDPPPAWSLKGQVAFREAHPYTERVSEG